MKTEDGYFVIYTPLDIRSIGVQDAVKLSTYKANKFGWIGV